ncbi:hypothetical protein ACFV2U_48145 [Streptomyces sp. NPDC059697]|uniref:hypothetical protein n=1 Tax=Streptomyces sp. NPDC059697 TaxID=3346912 RepID=UPI00369F8290
MSGLAIGLQSSAAGAAKVPSYAENLISGGFVEIHCEGPDRFSRKSTGAPAPMAQPCGNRGLISLSRRLNCPV